MSYVVTSDTIGNRDVTYGVAYAPSIRKQWMLQAHRPHVIEVAAYFRSAKQARDFAAAMGLTLTDRRES